jgi:hypothetical protein
MTRSLITEEERAKRVIHRRWIEAAMGIDLEAALHLLTDQDAGLLRLYYGVGTHIHSSYDALALGKRQARPNTLGATTQVRAALHRLLLAVGQDRTKSEEP